MATTNLQQWSSSKWHTLKIKIGLKSLIDPRPNHFLIQLRRWNHIPERGPYTVQYNGPLPYPNQSGVVENYHQNPPETETLSPRDTVSEMKRQLHFLDWCLNKIQNSLSELWLVPSATPKTTRQEFNCKANEFVAQQYARSFN